MEEDSLCILLNLYNYLENSDENIHSTSLLYCLFVLNMINSYSIKIVDSLIYILEMFMVDIQPQIPSKMINLVLICIYFYH